MEQISNTDEYSRSMSNQLPLHIAQSHYGDTFATAKKHPIDDSHQVLPNSPTVESFGVLSTSSSIVRPLGTIIEQPSFGQFQLLIGSLLLTTLLAVGSALDARNECIDQEMYSWLQELSGANEGPSNDGDDDYSDDFYNQEGRKECLNMFRTVVVPVGAATYIFGPIALIIIHRHLRYLETTNENNSPSHFMALLKLLIPLVIILMGWTYTIFVVMLKPKVDPGLYKQNPFKSLAAVDHLGRVGPNANMYYTCILSQTIIMVLVYQVMVECIRRFRREHDPKQISEVGSFSDSIGIHEHIQVMLSYTPARQLATIFKDRRRKWYQFMLHLRQRSGWWVAAFFSSLVLFASSAYVFVQVLVNIASSMSKENQFAYREVCSIIKGNDKVPEEFCVRTCFAILAGAISAALCLIAMILHIFVRRKAAADEERQNSCTVMAIEVLPGAMNLEKTRCHLISEMILSLFLSILLGLNAVSATGVQGPAATVGNLYYASWFSCFLCLRLCLGCLEEVYHVNVSPSDIAAISKDSSQGMIPQSSSVSGGEISLHMDLYQQVAKQERPYRLRKYFFIAIFSIFCSVSAWDAAYNQGTACTWRQKYLIYAPAVVAGLSVVMFLLCLKPRTYLVVSHLCFGGLMSIACFLIWLFDLIITMHSDESWAVNGIGEMKLANLYYGSWASILLVALQMISYIKPLFGSKSKDAMFLVWAGMVKVCMVILGAASHVWYNIRDSCGNSTSDEGEETFCQRTRFAMVVAVVGVLSGWSVMGSRILGCSISTKVRSRAEMVLSLLLVMLFGTAVAIITSIGGPGQSVGDMFYATWLSFGVSLHIFVSCYHQLAGNDVEPEIEPQYGNEGQPYSDFDTFQAARV